MHIAYCEDETAQAAAYIKAIRSWSEQNNRACYIEMLEALADSMETGSPIVLL